MTYSERLSTLSELSVDSLIKECRKHVPAQFVRYPYAYPELNHGLDLLASDEALDCYIAAYGEMHHAKCLGALQNMPYPLSSVETLSVEIVDWGCGQGIGSVAVIDYLRNRDLTQWLKKVTLIEPSQASLSRAIGNVKKATNNRVRIVPINEYLPEIDSNSGITGVSYDSKHVIHVFSNILDVANIDLGKLAKAVSSSGHIHYVLCMGPLNANSFRIDRFAEIFNPQEFFSNISDKSYGRTSDTNYVFTCKTKCFVHYGTTLDLSNYNPKETALTPVYGEYDVNLHIANGLFSTEKAWVYYRLQNVLNQNDLIYISPDINGAKPDFVIVRPNVGVAIINVFEQKIKDCIVDSETNLIKLHNENEDFGNTASPYVALENCKDLFIENFQELTESVISNNRNLGLVKTVLICTGGTREEAKSVLGEQRYVTTYGREFISDVSCSKSFFGEIRLYYPSTEFDDILLNRIKSDLAGGWHSYREGKDITLTKIQDNLSKSSAGSQHKISGVTGSGKTQVLATRAVNAQVRTGGNILLLTFNVTLANYMKLRLSEVRADFSWEKMHIDYYHRFFRKHAHANNLHVNFNSYNESDFFDSVRDTLPKYDAIFIDEVQDYLQPWLQLIRNNFLNDKGEFVVFGDPKQNIYNRELDEEGNVKLGIIPGLWNKQLTKSHRFSNPTLAKLALDYQLAFSNNTPSDDIVHNISDDASFIFDAIAYRFFNEGNPNIINQIYDCCITYIKENNIDIQDVAIISPQIEILRKIDTLYKSKQSNDTKLAFISQPGLDKISRQSTHASYEYNRDYNRLDKVMKNKFTMSSHLLKLSSIHSFKGWEAPTVICIIEKEKTHSENFNYDALIYTAITRAKENLLIINVGNDKYHNFFNSKISSL